MFIERLAGQLAGTMGHFVSRTRIVGMTARACRVAGADAMCGVSHSRRSIHVQRSGPKEQELPQVLPGRSRGEGIRWRISSIWQGKPRPRPTASP